MVAGDFNFKLNRTGLLKVTGMESVDDILFKRLSVFVFYIIQNMMPDYLF